MRFIPQLIEKICIDSKQILVICLFQFPVTEKTLIIIILRRKYFITWGKMKIDANRLFSNSVFAMWRSLRGTKYYIYTPRYIWRTYSRMPDIVVMINGFTIYGETIKNYFKVFLQIYANVENHYVLSKEYVIDITMEINYNLRYSDMNLIYI